ncbi:MAG: demethylmenaquinone methyltransferase / 2-octaprenyl-6-methoxy,4-benzoquinone methylase [Deltaproteobacteria bacterium]|nr:demethylmenaquinone methyltransferase / 2-octaprenyl-6-methoxy,4-benzoquinone methylase [Deltaproteobacteria bacterium]
MEHFDNIAVRYDIANTVTSFGMHYLWKHQAVRHLDLKEGERVLDVCGGTGDLAVLMEQAVGRPGRVVLSDLNYAMIRRGRYKSTNSAARRKILYVQSDAQEMAFRSASFDAAIAGFGIRNLVDMETGLKEIHRLLRPGGRFVCLEFSRPSRAWFRKLYDIYSFRIMPCISRLILGSGTPFLYLSESIRLFPGPDEFSGILADAGFRDVTYRLLTDGIAAVHKGRK